MEVAWRDRSERPVRDQCRRSGEPAAGRDEGRRQPRRVAKYRWRRQLLSDFGRWGIGPAGRRWARPRRRSRARRLAVHRDRRPGALPKQGHRHHLESGEQWPDLWDGDQLDQHSKRDRPCRELGLTRDGGRQRRGSKRQPTHVWHERRRRAARERRVLHRRRANEGVRDRHQRCPERTGCDRRGQLCDDLHAHALWNRDGLFSDSRHFQNPVGSGLKAQGTGKNRRATLEPPEP